MTIPLFFSFFLFFSGNFRYILHAIAIEDFSQLENCKYMSIFIIFFLLGSYEVGFFFFFVTIALHMQYLWIHLRQYLELSSVIFFFFLSWHAILDIFKIKIKPLATSAFSFQHSMAMNILTQG
jgi:hypothetical protein